MVKYLIDEIVKNVYVLRLDDYETKYFEALWFIPEGVTYNSYVVLTEEGAMLFDTWKHSYADLFIEALNNIIDLKDIKYIIVHHMEPDHSGALPTLLNIVNNAKVMGHPMVLKMLESFYGIKPSFKAVRDNEIFTFGKRAFRFIYTPWLHWPETIMTYLDDLGILFSCDAFGGFSIPSKIYDEEDIVNEYLHYVKKYIVTIVGHYKQFIIKNIEKISSLNIPIKIIAPAHGLIWKRIPEKIIEYYIKIAKGVPKRNKVIVIYSSMYGFVERAINIAINELLHLGYHVKIFRFTDKTMDSVANIIPELADAEAVIFGTATYESDVFPHMKYLLNIINTKASYKKPVLLITVYGWGPRAGKLSKEILLKSGFNVIDLIELKGKPSKDVENCIKAAVKELIKSIPANA